MQRCHSGPAFGNVKASTSEETEMTYTITLAVLALLTQAAGPAEKTVADTKGAGRGPAALAERPLCRGRGSLSGGR